MIRCIVFYGKTLKQCLDKIFVVFLVAVIFQLTGICLQPNFVKLCQWLTSIFRSGKNTGIPQTMTTDTQNHEAIRGLLENALRQVESTQSQVTAVEGQLHEIKSQIDHSLEAIDSVLKQLEARTQQVEQVRSDVAATLGEMFEQMTRIVNGARDQMLHHHDDESTTVNSTETPPTSELEEPSSMETTSEPENAIDDSVPSQPTLTEETPTESLTGPQAGRRATASLNEMIATIDETKMPQDTVPETQADTKPESEPVTKEMKGPGSADSLNTLLAKARAASAETNEVATELPPLVDEEEDAETVNEVLKNTSGSFMAQ